MCVCRYSGVTAEMMAGVTKRLPDVQRELAAILPPDAILVGQSLCGDLKVLKVCDSRACAAILKC